MTVKRRWRNEDSPGTSASAALTTLLLFLGVCVSIARGSAGRLNWTFTDSQSALCNDFTRAGFFHRQAGSGGEQQKWVVFLESGSLCYSSETCNRRYFQSHIRDSYTRDDSVSSRLRFGDFDTEMAWSETGEAGQPLTGVVNPLMTSLYCFRNESQYFSESESLSVEGTDILSSDCSDNPTFCNHGHVLVPYCSSDLWLGSDDREGGPCDCWDQECFSYNPTSEDLQFTFRGQTIFHSVLQTLHRLYNLETASEIVLVGSSAGGVGVLNSVKWAKDTFNNVSLKVIVDSMWFINFRDSLIQVFGTDTTDSTNRTHLFNRLSSNQACNDTRFGYPCCLSAPCLLNEAIGEPYYPRDVPLFAMNSVYDIFLLSDSISKLNDLAEPSLSSLTRAYELTSLIAEYGGALNASLVDTASLASSVDLPFTYYRPQCFQHMYLATSPLVHPGGLCGAETIEYSQNVVAVR